MDIEHIKPLAEALDQRFTQIIKSSRHPELAKCYCRWNHVSIAEEACIPTADIYNVALAHRIYPPDIGTAWFAAERHLETAYKEEKGGRWSEDDPLINWLYNFAADLADADDPTSRLVQCVAEENCREFSNTQPANLLSELALAAARAGKEVRARQLRRMADEPIHREHQKGATLASS